jgi:hypothetical protein
MSIHETIPSHSASACGCLWQSDKRVAWVIVAGQLLATGLGSSIG